MDHHREGPSALRRAALALVAGAAAGAVVTLLLPRECDAPRDVEHRPTGR